MSNSRSLSTRRPFPAHMRPLWGIVLVLSLLMPGCTTRRPAAVNAAPDPAAGFPAANAIPGWDISQKIETYNRDNLFNLVDGQADSFFAYGFIKVAVQRYQNAAGSRMNVEIWQLATPADAYGLFSSGRTGTPVKFGSEGDSDPGRRLAFWQNSYFVSLNAIEPVADGELQAFGKAIAGRLPAGGARPALVERLPGTGLDGQAIFFFHTEMSIQMEVWLGGENILGLSQATNGVLGRYKLGEATVRLVVVEYPDPGQAAKGLKALQSSQVADLVASALRGNLLGAVFGKVEPAPAQALLQEALK
jgi:hypothetical protein